MACTVIVDCSRSMNTEIESARPGWTRMKALLAGLQILAAELKSDPKARNTVELSVISVGGESPHFPHLVQDWTFARDFMSPSDLKADGSTPLGLAMLIALERTDDKKKRYRDKGVSYYRPRIIIISDGEPTDTPPKWAEAVRAARAAIAGKHADIQAVGIDGCPLERLNELSSKPALELSSHRFNEYFAELSNSLSRTVR